MIVLLLIHNSTKMRTPFTRTFFTAASCYVASDIFFVTLIWYDQHRHRDLPMHKDWFQTWKQINLTRLGWDAFSKATYKNRSNS